MKVELIRNVQIENTVHMAGSQVQISAELGKELVENHLGKEVKAKADKPAETKAKKSSK